MQIGSGCNSIEDAFWTVSRRGEGVSIRGEKVEKEGYVFGWAACVGFATIGQSLGDEGNDGRRRFAVDIAKAHRG